MSNKTLSHRSVYAGVATIEFPECVGPIAASSSAAEQETDRHRQDLSTFQWSAVTQGQCTVPAMNETRNQAFAETNAHSGAVSVANQSAGTRNSGPSMYDTCMRGLRFADEVVEAEFLVYYMGNGRRTVGYCVLAVITCVVGCAMYKGLSVATNVVYALIALVWALCGAASWAIGRKQDQLRTDAELKEQRLVEDVGEASEYDGRKPTGGDEEEQNGASGSIPPHLTTGGISAWFQARFGGESSITKLLTGHDSTSTRAGRKCSLLSLSDTGRARMRRNAMWQERINYATLIANFLFGMVNFAGKGTCYNPVWTYDDELKGCRRAIQTDATVFAMLILAPLATPTRVVGFAITYFVLTVAMLATRFLPMMIDVIYAYWGASAVVLGTEMLVCCVTLGLCERFSRKQFQLYVKCQQKLMEVNHVRRRATKLAAVQIPLTALRQLERGVASMAPFSWSPKAVCAVFGIRHFSRWAALRGPGDTIELLCRLVAAFDALRSRCDEKLLPAKFHGFGDHYVLMSFASTTDLAVHVQETMMYAVLCLREGAELVAILEENAAPAEHRSSGTADRMDLIGALMIGAGGGVYNHVTRNLVPVGPVVHTAMKLLSKPATSEKAGVTRTLQLCSYAAVLCGIPNPNPGSVFRADMEDISASGDSRINSNSSSRSTANPLSVAAATESSSQTRSARTRAVSIQDQKSNWIRRHVSACPDVTQSVLHCVVVDSCASLAKPSTVSVPALLSSSRVVGIPPPPPHHHVSSTGSPRTLRGEPVLFDTRPRRPVEGSLHSQGNPLRAASSQSVLLTSGIDVLGSGLLLAEGSTEAVSDDIASGHPALEMVAAFVGDSANSMVVNAVDSGSSSAPTTDVSPVYKRAVRTGNLAARGAESLPCQPSQQSSSGGDKAFALGTISPTSSTRPLLFQDASITDTAPRVKPTTPSSQIDKVSLIRRYVILYVFKNPDVEAEYLRTGTNSENGALLLTWSSLGTLLSFVSLMILCAIDKMFSVHPTMPLFYLLLGALFCLMMLGVQIVMPNNFLRWSHRDASIGVFSVMSTVCYLAAVATAHEGTVLGDSQFVWMFITFQWISHRPRWGSLLLMWTVDVMTSVFFVLRTVFLFNINRPSSMYLLAIFIESIGSIYTLVYRLLIDYASRTQFALEKQAEFLRQDLEKDFLRLESALAQTVPEGIAGRLVRNARRRNEAATHRRRVHPLWSTSFGTSTEEVPFVLVKVDYASILSMGEVSALESVSRLLSLIAAVGCACDAPRWKKRIRLVKVSQDTLMLCAPAPPSTSANGEDEQRASDSLAFALFELPRVFQEECLEWGKSTYEASPVGGLSRVAWKAVAGSGYLTGAAIGRLGVTFEYYGSAVAAAAGLLDQLPWNSLAVTSKVVHLHETGVLFGGRPESRHSSISASCTEQDAEEVRTRSQVTERLAQVRKCSVGVAGYAPQHAWIVNVGMTNE